MGTLMIARHRQVVYRVSGSQRVVTENNTKNRDKTPCIERIDYVAALERRRVLVLRHRRSLRNPWVASMSRVTFTHSRLLRATNARDAVRPRRTLSFQAARP